MDPEKPEIPEKDDTEKISETEEPAELSNGTSKDQEAVELNNRTSDIQNTELSNGKSKEVNAEEIRENEEELAMQDNEDKKLNIQDSTVDDKQKETKKTEKIAKKREVTLSNRLDYLSRPRKDLLDSLIEEKPDGYIPENAFPAWSGLPLQTKLPLALCGIPVTRKKLGEDLFLPPPANDFDLGDENNLQLPAETYSTMHDPCVERYVRNQYVYDHLLKEGFITETERAVCTLSDLHKYRRYQRRILAAQAQKKLRDQDEELRRERAEGMEQKIKRDVEKYHELRKQGAMRRWIKDTVASIRESSMENQRIRDMRVLNSYIRRQRAQRERVEALKERYQRLYAEHMRNKYADAEKDRREAHLALAKEDLKHLEKLCKKQEEARLQKQEKLHDFYKRKFDSQKEWLEKGLELELMRQEEREKNIAILKRTGHLPTLHTKKSECGSDQVSRSNVKPEEQTKDEMAPPGESSFEGSPDSEINFKDTTVSGMEGQSPETTGIVEEGEVLEPQEEISESPEQDT